VLGPEDRLDLTRLGPVRIGMTLAEAEQAAGVPFVVPQMQPDVDGLCTVVRPESTLPGVTFLLVDQRITMIHIDAPATNPTRSGVRVGSSEQQVRETYGDALEEREHPYYADEPGRAVYLVVVPDGERQSLLVEVVDGTVTSFSVGLLPQLIAGYGEGCVAS